jgi:hypothetical protein
LTGVITRPQEGLFTAGRVAAFCDVVFGILYANMLYKVNVGGIIGTSVRAVENSDVKEGERSRNLWSNRFPE